MSILKVEEAIAALAAAALLQILEESVVGGVARSNHLDVDLLFVFDVEDYISVFLIFLYLLVSRLADIRNSYSWRLEKRKKTVSS